MAKSKAEANSAVCFSIPINLLLKQFNRSIFFIHWPNAVKDYSVPPQSIAHNKSDFLTVLVFQVDELFSIVPDLFKGIFQTKIARLTAEFIYRCFQTFQVPFPVLKGDRG